MHEDLARESQRALAAAQQEHAAAEQQGSPYRPTERETQHLRHLEQVMNSFHQENSAVRNFAQEQAAAHQLARAEVLKLTTGEILSMLSPLLPASGPPE